MTDRQVAKKRMVVGWKAVRCWFWPFCKARWHFDRFRPVLSFLFTDLACNYRCYYCYASHVPEARGMTLETAKQSVDWLQSVGCRVLAFMGGEPLVRREFILEVSRYAHERGLYVYLPTNGVLLDEAFIEEAADAGVDVFNLAVDCLDEKPGLPKALNRVRAQYELLLEKSRTHKFLVMFNVNITPRNLEDVKALTEIAHQDRINADYHMLEPPLWKMSHFDGTAEETSFAPGDCEKADALFDWLHEKYGQGYNMANSPRQFQEAKRFIRREPVSWDCRAGINTVVIRTDGRLAPCFEYFQDGEDWGQVGAPKFDRRRLQDFKQQCNHRCLSTCNFTTSFYFSFSTVLEWVSKYYLVRS